MVHVRLIKNMSFVYFHPLDDRTSPLFDDDVIMDENLTLIPPLPQVKPKPSLLLYISAIVALVNALSAGLVIGYYSAGFESMQDSVRLKPNIKWDEENSSWVASSLALGALVGSLVAGPVASNLGPKFALLLNNLPFLGGWAFLVFGKTLPLIITGRLIGGFSVGFACGSVPVYVLEISTESIRGLLGTGFQVRSHF